MLFILQNLIFSCRVDLNSKQDGRPYWSTNMTEHLKKLHSDGALDNKSVLLNLNVKIFHTKTLKFFSVFFFLL